ncbi:MAG: aromatic amino acid permease [Parcubacteria group bacterium Gr01-1014_44]|nr:MAG: aromatic amino acid permease [Parcubacteria group bacterium Gr01-1014_44]
MNMVNSKFLTAVAVLVSGVIGVGIFGVPFVFAKAGLLTGLLFLVGLAVLILAVNLAYGEVILRTDQAHQLVGYAGIYLGDFAKKLTFFAFVLGIYSALLAYIVVAGEFLTNIVSFKFYFSPGSLGTLFFVAGALLLAAGFKTIVKVDFWAALLYLAAVAGIGLLSISHLDFSNFTLFNGEFWFLPYGVILFALTGMSSIVLQREVLEGEEFLLKKAILWGTLIPAIIYLFLAVVVVGISGEATSVEAMAGLVPFLGQKIIILGSLFGLLAIFTSFINLGRVLQESFQFDWHLNKFLAWFLALFPPFFIFLLGVRDFINIISLAGALAIGLQSIIFIFIYGRVKKLGHRIPEYSLGLPKWFWYLAVALFSLGAVLALIK